MTTCDKRRTWTTSELARLKENYRTSDDETLKALFPERSLAGIRRKAWQIGLVGKGRSCGGFCQGQRHGLITLESSVRRPDEYGVRHRHWTCTCRCGRRIELTDQQLLTGLFRSCPECIDRDDLPELKTKLLGLLKETCNKGNALGVRGVYLDSKSGKYSAYMQVQGRRIRLGQYETLETAAKVRSEFVESLRPILNMLLEERDGT